MYKMRNTLCCIAQIRNNYNTELLLVVLGSFSLANSWNSPLTTIVLFLLALILYAFTEILLRRFGTWRPISESKPVEQQEYLLPTIGWSMLTALGMSLLVFVVTALLR